MEDVPLIVRAKYLPDGTPITEALEAMLRSYLASLPEDRRRLLSRYRIIDVARKVVGVGSVGTSCWVVLLEEQGEPAVRFSSRSRKRSNPCWLAISTAIDRSSSKDVASLSVSE